MAEKTKKDKLSAIETTKEKCIAEGEHNAKIETANKKYENI